MTLSELVADAISQTGYKQLPPTVIQNVKKLVLDHLGVAAVGSTMPWGIIVNKVARSGGGEGRASVYFSGNKVPATTAALINGTYAHGFELDDNLWTVHPGCTVIPAAIAAAELQGGVDGGSFITGVVLGYEVQLRVARTVGSEMSEAGHHPTGTTGQFGATVAAGKILGLDREALVSALGLAGDFPTGRCEFFRGSMDKRIFAGRAAEAGVLSCLLAREGFTGPRTVFEGEYGFCHTISKSVHLDRLLEGLGEQFYIEDIHVKRYACAGAIRPFIDAALSLRENAPQRFSDVSNVSAIVLSGRGRVLNTRRTSVNVKDVMTAQYSIPYGVATAFRHGRPAPADFLEEAISDPGVQSLLACFEIERQDGADAHLKVQFKDGSALETRVVETNQTVSEWSHEGIVDKFLELTSPLPGFGSMHRMIDMVDRLDALSDIRMLTELFEGTTART